MLDMQWMQSPEPMRRRNFNPDMTLPDRSFGTARFANFGNNLFQTLGDLLGKRFNQQYSANPVAQQPGETQTVQQPQPMGTQYNNPFGASVTSGTLGAMLARQPTY